MIMCSKCKKRPAVVFITSMQGNEKKNEGLCMVCAKEMKIPQVSEYMEQLGISDEEIEQISDQMMGLLDGDSFEMGGSGFMPDFLQNMFSAAGNLTENKEESEEKQDDKKNGSKKDKSDKKGGCLPVSDKHPPRLCSLLRWDVLRKCSGCRWVSVAPTPRRCQKFRPLLSKGHCGWRH